MPQEIVCGLTRFGKGAGPDASIPIRPVRVPDRPVTWERVGAVTYLERNRRSIHPYLVGPSSGLSPDRSRLLANGTFFTIDHNGLYKDLHVTNVGGTLYQFVSKESGHPYTVRDMAGAIVLKDRGVLFTTFVVDTLGDSDPDNDVFVDGSFSLLKTRAHIPRSTRTSATTSRSRC